MDGDEAPVNPAVKALLEEIARAKLRAEERRIQREESSKKEYGVIKQEDGSIVLQLPPAPEKPRADECCNSGCTPCILDTYWERVRAHDDDVRALQAQYQRVLSGEPLDTSEHHIRQAHPGWGILDPLKFVGIRVMHTDELQSSYGRVFVLEATAADFVLSLGEHIHIRANIKGTDGNWQMVTRPFTPVMIEAEDSVVRPHLFIRIYEGNRMSEYFRRLRTGQSIAARGPVTTIENLTRAFGGSLCVLVAGGSGIAPVFQALQFAHINSAYRDKRLVVVQCAREHDGLWLNREISEIARDMERMTYTTVVSGQKGRLTDAVLRKVLESDGAELQEAHAIVCGPGTFNTDIGGWLQALGVRDIQAL
ncbi:NADH-cytochrome b5 reductase-like [Coemansia sp. RSA 1813]|nr:NADH-cytochrome b5 reductase-like [Coemansia sp. RSA 1646]KAJ1769475.1 NADH-cytochrome b5 reductase-like [Coemansia sp. RSA 1843]KAJ2088074.1 NADH-cytochrome b5 reductase-like [Coemansia sp. RSA 986]KAJ2214861.1 NADH-cytochrome b5 reductase-like [Coemansia sp. RSA 487]KAJ2568050.1 NADH-cytochrome b5 reductase-like [Coemansia sp. RSA 1813]